MVPGEWQQAEWLASGSATAGRPADQRTRSLVAKSCQYPRSAAQYSASAYQYAPSAAFIVDVAGPSMTGDLEPQHNPGSNVWPTRPVPARIPMAPAGTNWSTPTAPVPISPGARQVWRARSEPPPPGGHQISYPLTYVPPVSHEQSTAGSSVSSAMYRSLIWLSLMFVALTILLISFALWDRPVIHQSAPPTTLSQDVLR